MAENFYEMYLEEMGGITPLTEQEKKALLKETARGDAGARSRLVAVSYTHLDVYKRQPWGFPINARPSQS